MTPGPKDQTELRAIIAEDTVLLREELRRVLTDVGLDVAGTAGDAEQLLAGIRVGSATRSRSGSLTSPSSPTRSDGWRQASR